MCLLEVYAQCDDRFFEVSSDEVEHAELIVEELVSRVLLDLFDEGMVDDVDIRFSANPHTGFQQCSIHINAECNCRAFTLEPRTKKNMECAVEKNMHILLREIFGHVKVNSVMRCPSFAMAD
ncbi:hypothetical protein KSF_091760 [Reticulibacter mediterranei]|uniref:Uncharacterized protein n=1 Tax=Reticulibacter mediterranei TaxID=2778369 RepID=A0A8J3N7Z0_9CHLR|nr:hypothetical protein KSF_091760 [Reticulibacter mediterranei]